MYLITLNDTHTRTHHHPLARTALDEVSARRRDLYPTTQNLHKTSMLAAGFEPAIPASEWPQTHVRPPGSAIQITNPTNLGRYVGVWMM